MANFTWRCTQCGDITNLTDAGGNLNCSCAPGALETRDFEFKSDEGRFADGEWHSMRGLLGVLHNG